MQETKEHDLPLTGYDWLGSLGIFVTADRSGIIRLWSDSKKFLREIKFPASHPIDSVAFANAQGDLLVSHCSRISIVKFETYWKPTFSQFRITTHDDPVHIAHRNSKDYDEDFDDFIVTEDLWQTNVKRICEEDRTLHLIEGGLDPIEIEREESNLRSRLKLIDNSLMRKVENIKLRRNSVIFVKKPEAKEESKVLLTPVKLPEINPREVREKAKTVIENKHDNSHLKKTAHEFLSVSSIKPKYLFGDAADDEKERKHLRDLTAQTAAKI